MKRQIINRQQFKTGFILSCLTLISNLILSQSPMTMDQMDSLIRSSTYKIEFTDSKLNGPGLDWLLKEADIANYFLIGERHGTAETPQLSASIYENISKGGYDHAILEIGEYAAYKVQSLLNSGGFYELESFLNNPDYTESIAFLDWKEEASLVSSITQNSAQGNEAIWGVDQEFIFGCAMYLDMLKETAYTEDQKKEIELLHQSLQENKFLLGSDIKQDLEQLKKLYDPSKDKASIGLLDALIISNRIYGRFRGEITRIEANTMRENLMKTTFRDLILEYEKLTGKSSKVFIKMGGYHSAPYIGMGKTSFGTFVEEWAISRNEVAFNLFIDINGGKIISSGQDNPKGGNDVIEAKSQLGIIDPTESDLNTRHVFSKLLKDRSTILLIDLRPLRANMDRVSPFLNDKAINLITGFDAYLAIPNVTPSTAY